MLTITFPLQMPPPRVICNSNKNTLQKAYLGGGRAVEENRRSPKNVQHRQPGIIKLLDSVQFLSGKTS